MVIRRERRMCSFYRTMCKNVYFLYGLHTFRTPEEFLPEAQYTCLEDNCSLMKRVGDGSYIA
jgi:hypothetical protein